MAYAFYGPEHKSVYEHLKERFKSNIPFIKEDLLYRLLNENSKDRYTANLIFKELLRPEHLYADILRSKYERYFPLPSVFNSMIWITSNVFGAMAAAYGILKSDTNYLVLTGGLVFANSLLNNTLISYEERSHISSILHDYDVFLYNLCVRINYESLFLYLGADGEVSRSFLRVILGLNEIKGGAPLVEFRAPNLPPSNLFSSLV